MISKGNGEMGKNSNNENEKDNDSDNDDDSNNRNVGCLIPAMYSQRCTTIPDTQPGLLVDVRLVSRRYHNLPSA